MPTLELLRRKIETASDLQSVVTTMKTLAAVRIHQYQRAADALMDYNRTIELGLQVILREQRLRHLPASEWGGENPKVGGSEENSHHGVIVIGSDQGMCGQFNEQIAAHALEHHAKHCQRPPEALWIVGARVAFLLTDSGWSIDEAFRIPTSVPEIADCVSDLLTAVEAVREQRHLTTLRIYANMRSSAGAYQPNTTQLLPIDLAWLQRLSVKSWESPCLPTFGGEREELFSLLVRQSLYVSLYQACAESLASENASRIAAMQAAEKNIEETLDELNTAFKTQRQTAITEELLDVVVGFEALTSGS
ncbi:ATP synthase gamma chain [Rhodopirellula islandica]|uniref:ATP synthase gamma chain n=1 Tax=Rhodopirellula islandica TaxID=595434 RepID=A0A0J1BGB7_RHOIS|nr:F0F1 ATP synthase subunit gamma [Rhodopirellula islandica]KLU05587.1 ATP synthase gamma chain [Rhodopirellula islandica]